MSPTPLNDSVLCLEACGIFEQSFAMRCNSIAFAPLLLRFWIPADGNGSPTHT